MEKLFKRFCVFLSGLLIICSVSMVLTMPVHARESAFDFFGCNELVQNIENLEINLTSVIYVKNTKGNWEEYQRIHGNENRIWADIENVPQQLIDAFVSIEDERFFTHGGVDWKRTLGAAGNLIFKYYSSNQGGSTMTQQLIKNLQAIRKQTHFVS